MIHRAVILAGGNGTRLLPATSITNKHLLPIYDRPMILYSLQTLLDMGIREILFICGNEHTGGFTKLLGSGAKFDAHFTFRVQDGAMGIADALRLAEDFAQKENIAVILGDNIFENTFVQDAKDFSEGAQLFVKKVPDAHRFGVVEKKGNRIVRIEEKPKNPKSDLAATGLYFFDHTLFEKIKNITLSERKEYEIVDVHRQYIAEGRAKVVEIFGNWSDAGTHESFFHASKIAREISLVKSRNQK